MLTLMNSPLGKYAAPTAAAAAIILILAYVVSLMFGVALQIDAQAASNLKDFAFLAAGAVFGSAVAVNGYKAPLNAIHKRLDDAGIPAAANPTDAE